MVVAEGPKIFDVHCIWGKIFVSLEKIFVFKYSQTIFVQFLREISFESDNGPGYNKKRAGEKNQTK